MESVLVYLTFCCLFFQVVRCFYQPIYADQSNILYNATGDSKRYPDQTLIAVEDYNYFISDFNFEAIRGKLMIGAADRLFLLNPDLTVNASVELLSSSSELNACTATTTIDNKNFTCRNHIRVYRRIPGQNTLLVCGTHAGEDPRCYGLDLSGGDLSSVGNSVVASDGLISYYPQLSGFGEFRNDSNSDAIYLSAGFFQGTTGVGRHFSISYIDVTLTTPSDPSTLETTEQFRTINANNNWLRFPVTFVGSQKVDYSSTSSPTDYQFWFVFLRENLVSGDVIYSRLVRICRNDPGSETTSGGARYFTTYMKARIFCKRDKPSSLEFTGTLDYIYNSITSFAFTDSSRYYGGGDYQKLLYGAFTGQLSGPVGSALCVYPADNTAESGGGVGRSRSVFDIFREDVTTSPTDATTENNFLECDPEGRQGGDQQLLFINPDMSVQQIGNDPILVLDDVVVTQIVQDSVCVVTRDDNSSCVNQDILFLGLDSGRILKVVFRTDNNGDSDPVVAENIQLDDDNAVNKMTLEEGSGMLYVSTWSKIYRLPTHRCARFDSCSSCVGSRDPYCVWSDATLQCVESPLTASGSSTGSVNSTLYFQNIHTGQSSGCNYPQIRFVESSISVNEAMLSVELSVMASGPSYIELYLESGTATAGSDFNPDSAQVVEFTSASIVNVSIGLFGDSVVEGDEWFRGRLRGTNMSGVIVTQDSIDITIVDDDSVEVSFSEMSYSGNEGGSFITVTLNKDGDTEFDTSVTVKSSDGTAMAGTDYLQQDLDLTFNTTTTSLQIVIPLVNDDVMEVEEEFFLSLHLANGAIGAVLTFPNTTGITVTDDDEVYIGLSVSGSFFYENNGSVTVVIEKNGLTDQTLSVLLSTVNGTATAPSDFIAKNEEITFSPNETSKTSTVTIVDDAIAEDDEVFELTISTPPDAPSGLQIALSAVTITLMDTDTVIVRLSSTTYTWTEGDGEVTVLIEKIGTNERNISASLQTHPRSAKVGLDYVMQFDEVQFSPSDTQKEVTLEIVDDDELEDTEMFFLTLNIGQGASADQTSFVDAIILDNDNVSIQFGIETCALTVAESARFVEVVVTKLGLSSIPVEVMLQTQDGTATDSSDYISVMEIFNISSNASSYVVEVPLVDDGVVEDREIFIVSLSLVGEQTGLSIARENTANITILDDDSVLVSLAESSVAVSEEDGVVTIPLMLTGAHSIPVTATVSTLSGTAIAGEDFTSSAEIVTFNPGASVSITILDDDIREEIETFKVSVSGDNITVTTGSISETTVQIMDSDTVSLQWSSESYTVMEGIGSIGLTLIKVGATSFDVNAVISATDNSTQGAQDFVISTVDLTFTPDQAVHSVEVMITDDVIAELTESLTVIVDVVNRGIGQSTEVIIKDDDMVSVRWESSSYTVSETSGSVELTLLPEGTTSYDITLTVTTLAGSATAGEDYEALSNTMVVLSPADLDIRVELLILNDEAVEGQEVLMVVVAAESEENIVIMERTAYVYIISDDVVQVQFSQVSYTAMEGERIDVLIIANTTASFDIQVFVSTQELSVSQDYYLPHNPVTIIAGDTTARLPLFLVTDVEVADAEQLRLELVLVNGTESIVVLGANTAVVITVENVDVCVNATDPSTTNQTNTSDSTEPSIQTPSTGMLSTDSDHLFESQGSAIAVVTTLSVMVVILCITNALTAGYLCIRLPVFRRKTIPNATDAVLQLQEKGGIGAANSSFTEETIIANKGAEREGPSFCHDSEELSSHPDSGECEDGELEQLKSSKEDEVEQSEL